MLREGRVSVTCEVSRELGVEWFLTKESGRVPAVCAQMWMGLRSMEGVLRARTGRSVLAVKVVGGPGEFEVLVAPLAHSTLSWLREEIAMALGQALTQGPWEEVAELCRLVAAETGCSERCVRGADCATRLLWQEVGWRRVHVPEVCVPRLPHWLIGVTDAVGDCGEWYGPWLRCPCGVLVGGATGWRASSVAAQVPLPRASIERVNAQTGES